MKTFFIILLILIGIVLIFKAGCVIGYATGYQKGIQSLIDRFDNFVKEKEKTND